MGQLPRGRKQCLREKEYMARRPHSRRESRQRRRGLWRREGAPQQLPKPWKPSGRTQGSHRRFQGQHRAQRRWQRPQRVARQRSQRKRRLLLQRSASSPGNGRRLLSVDAQSAVPVLLAVGIRASERMEVHCLRPCPRHTYNRNASQAVAGAYMHRAKHHWCNPLLPFTATRPSLEGAIDAATTW